MTTKNIERNWEVFDTEGGAAFGAVRHVEADHLIVYVENSGDTRIDSEAIQSVHDGKVLVDCAQLPESIRNKIRHAHDRET